MIGFRLFVILQRIIEIKVPDHFTVRQLYDLDSKH